MLCRWGLMAQCPRTPRASAGLSNMLRTASLRPVVAMPASCCRPATLATAVSGTGRGWAQGRLWERSVQQPSWGPRRSSSCVGAWNLTV